MRFELVQQGDSFMHFGLKQWLQFSLKSIVLLIKNSFQIILFTAFGSQNESLIMQSVSKIQDWISPFLICGKTEALYS